MSAGGATPIRVVRSFDPLAPKFRAALEAGLADCQANGLDAIAFETMRSPELAALYYKRGRPPTAEYPRPVTHAIDASFSWHGYGLAADIISASKEWDAGDAWFAAMGAIMQHHGLQWGGSWGMKDLPHVQFGTLKRWPSVVSRSLYAEGKIASVWALVGAV